MARDATNEVTGVVGNASLTDADGRLIIVGAAGGAVSTTASSTPTGTTTGAYATVSIGTSAAVIKAANPTRRTILVQNLHATNVLYVGTDASVTTAAGLRVNPGDALEIASYTGAVYGIASAASTDVRYLEFG